MPKPINQNPHASALAEATAHLQKISITDLEIASCDAAIVADGKLIEQLRTKRLSVTDLTAMKTLSTQQRAAELEAADHLDLRDALQNRRQALRNEVAEVWQRFTVAHNAFAAKLTAEFSARYEAFLKEAVTPIVELAQALSSIGSIGNITSGLIVPNVNSGFDFVRSGNFVVPRKTSGPEATAALEAITPWAYASHTLQFISRELATERHKAAQAETKARGPQTTPPHEYIPIETGKPWQPVEISGKGFAHMNPGAFERGTVAVAETAPAMAEN